MDFPTENREKTHLLKLCMASSIDGSEASLPHQNGSASSSDHLKALSLSVTFCGWRFASKDFKFWAKKMSDLHHFTWRKAGIFEAIIASTKKIHKNTDIVLGIAEKWFPETNTFVFPWGEATITLEDVSLLLGFSILGLPHFARLDSSGEKTRAKLENECLNIKKDRGFYVNQVAWISRFMDSGDELEHVAFLVAWLSYFVFPSRYYHLDQHMFSVAVHLSRGKRIALAPPVLAHLYAELSLLRNHVRDFEETTIPLRIDVSSLFKLVQVWTWERFIELQPKPKLMRKGEPRLARWDDLRQRTSNAREILENSGSFEWRPYTKTVENWQFPKFYPEKAVYVLVDSNLDDEFISFARCIKVSKLVGIDCLEHYNPDRVASQFGLLQDVPCPVNKNNLSKKGAWNDYNKNIDDLTLYIPSRFATPCVTPMYCEWRKTFPAYEEITRIVPSGSKRRSENGTKIAKDSRKKRRKYMKLASEGDESTMCCYQTQVPLDNDEEDRSLAVANNDMEPCQKLALIRADGDETVPPPEREQRYKESDEAGNKTEKNLVLCLFDENFSAPSLGSNEGVIDIVPSPPKVRQTSVDELDHVYGSNADIINDGSKEPTCLLLEDGGIAGEKAVSDEKMCCEAEKEDVDDGRLIQKKLRLREQARKAIHDKPIRHQEIAIRELARKANNDEPSCLQKLASRSSNGDETSKTCKSMVPSPSNESEIHITAGDITQRQDCLLHDDAMEEAMQSNEQLENDDVSNESIQKSLHKLNMTMTSVEERINKVQRKVILLKEKRAMKQRKIAEGRIDLDVLDICYGADKCK